jgi:arginine repressor
MPERVRGASAVYRQIIIRQIIQEMQGKISPCREMAELLKERSVEASYATISTDYKALGLKTKRIHQREAKTNARERQKDLQLNHLQG